MGSPSPPHTHPPTSFYEYSLGVSVVWIVSSFFGNMKRFLFSNYSFELAIRHREPLCTMECQARACPLCWARRRAGLLGCVRWHAHHNGQGDAFPWHWGSWVADSTTIFFFDKFMFNRHFGHFYYECIMVIIGRLCHAICSRKWCNLPPQILM